MDQSLLSLSIVLFFILNNQGITMLLLLLSLLLTSKDNDEQDHSQSGIGYTYGEQTTYWGENAVQ